MRTNIILDDNLIHEAFRYTTVSSKKALVDLALREFIENHRRRDIRELRGKVKLRDDYNYKELRS
ncbi:hypothetical protein BH10PSE19_BH10PSE19_09380 [soil metagenome]